MVRGFLIAYATLTASGLALAGPPFMTDDPETVEYQHNEFYVSSQQVTTQDARSGTLVHFEYNHGATPNLQLHIVVPLAFNNPSEGPSHHGLGDIELGAKYRFLDETDNQPMAGIFPLVITPAGNSGKGLGNGNTQMFLPVWLQKKWGEWQSYGGGGYWINNAANTKNHWFAGWQLQKDISGHLTLGGEIYHSTEAVAGEGASTGFSLGGTYNLDDHNHLLFSVGRGLTNASKTNEFSSYLGYQLTW
jgi:hypothetical protein